MPMRLSELLERIRPAGTPGAPSEGELQRRDDRRAAELEAIVAILSSFEAEADTVIETAQAEAGRIRRQGEDRTQEITAAVSDLIAVAEAEAAHRLEQHDQVELNQLLSQTEQTISQLQRLADGQTPIVVDEAMEVVWAQLLPPITSPGPPS
jgi:hypothetical protein